MSQIDGKQNLNANRSGLLGLLAMSVFMLLGIIFLVWLGTPNESPAEGQAIQRLELKPLLNCDEPLSEQALLGKVTVLHFWGTWCEPCRKEFPEFVSIARQLNDDAQVQLISVTCSRGVEYDLEQLKKDAAAYVATLAPQMPIYADPAALSRSQIGMLLPNAMFSYPCTIVTDQRGIIVGVWQGYTELGMKEVLAKVQELTSKVVQPAA